MKRWAIFKWRVVPCCTLNVFLQLTAPTHCEYFSVNVLSLSTLSTTLMSLSNTWGLGVIANFIHAAFNAGRGVGWHHVLCDLASRHDDLGNLRHLMLFNISTLQWESGRFCYSVWQRIPFHPTLCEAWRVNKGDCAKGANNHQGVLTLWRHGGLVRLSKLRLGNAASNGKQMTGRSLSLLIPRDP